MEREEKERKKKEEEERKKKEEEEKRIKEQEERRLKLGILYIFPFKIRSNNYKKLNYVKRKNLFFR